MKTILKFICIALTCIPYFAVGQILSSSKQLELPKKPFLSNKFRTFLLSDGEKKNLIKTDSIELSQGSPYKFGKSFDTDIEFFNEATVYSKGDSTVSIYEVKTTGAYSTNFIFDKISLNENSHFVSSSDKCNTMVFHSIGRLASRWSETEKLILCCDDKKIFPAHLCTKVSN